MSLTRRGLLVAGLACAALPARADDWDALGAPGAVALMRHARAPGTGDPPGFTPGLCATQRNLDAAGRAQAAAVGAEMRARGITFDRVLSSEWCRCLETARLLNMGPVEPAPAFNSFFGGRGNRAAQTRAALDILRGRAGPMIAVTHQVNISALTGRPVSSGEVVIVRPEGDGVAVLGAVVLAA